MAESDHNETFIEELVDIQSFLATVNEIFPCDSEEAFDSCTRDNDFAEQLASTHYLDALSEKWQQLQRTQAFLEKKKDFPNREVIQELMNDIVPKCKLTLTVLKRIRARHFKEPAEDDFSDDDEEDENDDDDDGHDQQESETPDSDDDQIVTDPDADRDLNVSDGVRAIEGLLDLTGFHRIRREGNSSGPTPLDEWIEENSIEGNTLWIVNRTSNTFLDDVFEKYFVYNDDDMRKTLVVNFTGEYGLDMGALTREFFYIAMEAVGNGMFKERRLMEGERGHLIPSNAQDHRAFRLVGKMIGHAVLNGCRGMHGLSPAIVHYLVHGTSLNSLEESHPPINIDDVADKGLHDVLVKLEDSRAVLTDDETSCLSEWMSISNCPVRLAPTTRLSIVQHLLIHYTFLSRIRQIDAIADGMDSLGLRNYLKKEQTDERISFVFPSPDAIKVTDQMFLATIITRGDVIDIETLEFFKTFVSELHSGKVRKIGADAEKWVLNDLIQFMTSSVYLPHRTVVSFSGETSLPIAHACYNEIELPIIHRKYNDFKMAMITAFENGLSGFGLQ